MLCLNINLSATEVDDLINQCNDALDSCTEQVNKQRDLIQVQDELVFKLIKQRDEVYSKVEADADRLPWYFWTAIGLATGVVISHTVIFHE